MREPSMANVVKSNTAEFHQGRGFHASSTVNLPIRPRRGNETVPLSSDATLDLIAYLKRSCAVMSHVADSPKNRHFEPISGRFTPIRPTNHRCERNGLPNSWHPGNVGGPHRLPGHCSPVSRSTPEQRAQVMRRPSPAGYCLPPTVELAKTDRGPISTSGLYIQYVTGWTLPSDKSVFFPRSSPSTR